MHAGQHSGLRSPSHNGFVSVRPGNAVGVPATSNLNVVAQQTVPNAVTVAGATTNLLVDVVGYYNDHNHDDRYYTKTQIDSAISSAVSTAIEANPGFDPAFIVWVAKSGGDFTTVTAAMNSITDASATNPYVVRVAPGVYSERVVLKNHVQLEGSGQDATSIVAPTVERGGR